MQARGHVMGGLDACLSAIESLHAQGLYAGDVDSFFALVEAYPGERDVTGALEHQVCLAGRDMLHISFLPASAHASTSAARTGCAIWT